MSTKTVKNRKKRQRKAAKKRAAAVRLLELAPRRAVAKGKGAYVVRRSGNRPLVRGRGAYFAPDYFERLGDQVFGPTGKLVGEGVGNVLRAFGLGKYDLQQNSLMSKIEMDPGDDVPRIRNDYRGEGFLIQHEEYIGDLFTAGSGGTPTVFSIETENLNPANEDLFPWLSTVAVNFEEWEPKGIIFTLKTMASDVSTALSLGMMFGAVQYDALDEVFVNKEELLNYEGANSVKVSHSCMVPVECKPGLDTLTHLYVKPGNILPEGADTRFYDLGNVSFGTSGCPAADTPVAEIWVSYEIAFFKPKLTAGGDLATLWESAHFDVKTGCSNAAYFGSAPEFIGGLEGFVSMITNTLTFADSVEAGAYLLSFGYNGTGAACSVPAVAPNSSCSVHSIWTTGTTSMRGAQNALAAQTMYSWTILVQVLDHGAALVLSGGVIPTSLTGAELFITKVNSQTITA